MKKKIWKVIFIVMAATGLLLTLVPSFFNWQGLLSPENTHKLMLAGTILWFLGAIFLFGKAQRTVEAIE
jgi:glycopeptide antibiotics resistance protein